MRDRAADARSAAGRPADALARWALVAFCAFVVYGSLFPFRFTTNPIAVERALARATRPLFDAGGRRLFSIADVGSNVLLGAPVGLLAVAGGLGGRSPLARLAVAVALELVFASAVELAQAFTPNRTASALDVVAQVAGAGGGAVAALFAQTAARQPWGATAVRAVRERPGVALALALGAVLAADAFYPFVITLDVSTAAANLRAARLRPLGSLSRGFWPDLLVEKAALAAALAAACRVALTPVLARGAAAGAWALTVAFAAALEIGKLGFVGRSPNVDNALFAGLGAVAGVLIAPVLGRPAVRARAPALLVLAAVTVLAWEELTPFDVTASLAAAHAKAARIEWLPFGSYYGAEAQSALFDLGKKLGLGAFLGAALRATGWRWPAAWGLALAAALEALQVFQVSHIPALTDVLDIGAGAALGAWALDRWRAAAGTVTTRAAAPSSRAGARVSDAGH